MTISKAFYFLSMLFVGFSTARCIERPDFSSPPSIKYPVRSPAFMNPMDFVDKPSALTRNLTDIYQIYVNTEGMVVRNATLPPIPSVNEEESNTTRTPVWWDDFDGNSLDISSWAYMEGAGPTGWGNGELQTYTIDNVAVSDGFMHISALKDSNGDWTSGRVHSRNAWYPGMVAPDGQIVSKIYFEALVVVPEAGNGLWPGFWAYPENSMYGEYAQSGEIDLMELRDSFDKVTSGIHYGGCEPDNLRNMTRTFSTEMATFAGESFVFGCEWTLDTIVFTINGVETTRRVSKELDPEFGWFSEASNAKISSPFDEAFHVIFNIAVGGNFPRFKVDETTPHSVTMSIDYFRVFADFA